MICIVLPRRREVGVDIARIDADVGGSRFGDDVFHESVEEFGTVLD